MYVHYMYVCTIGKRGGWAGSVLQVDCRHEQTKMNDLTIHKEHVRTGRGIPSTGLLGKDLSNVLYQVEPDGSHVGSRSSRLVPPL